MAHLSDHVQEGVHYALVPRCRHDSGYHSSRDVFNTVWRDIGILRAFSVSVMHNAAERSQPPFETPAAEFEARFPVVNHDS